MRHHNSSGSIQSPAVLEKPHCGKSLWGVRGVRVYCVLFGMHEDRAPTAPTDSTTHPHPHTPTPSTPPDTPNAPRPLHEEHDLVILDQLLDLSAGRRVVVGLPIAPVCGRHQPRQQGVGGGGGGLFCVVWVWVWVWPSAGAAGGVGGAGGGLFCGGGGFSLWFGLAVGVRDAQGALPPTSLPSCVCVLAVFRSIDAINQSTHQ